MVSDEIRRGIKADLLLTAIQSVQYVADGETFAKTTAEKYNIELEEARKLTAAHSREMVNRWFSEYRVLRKRPTELDDSSFHDWLTQEFHSWSEECEDFDTEYLAKSLPNSVEEALQE